jgi:glycosyltransferase involved in cell wall biosynthesis
MKLSIVIPCFNAEKTIALQLEALANQEWDKLWEVIISDNGSTDKTLEIIEQFQNRIPNLRIINACEQKGAAYARNCGVQASQAESVAFIDADDEVALGWVAAIGNALSTYDFVTGQVETQKLNPSWLQSTRTGYGPRTRTVPPPSAASSQLAVKRCLFNQVGGFDSTFKTCEDHDFCWRLYLQGVHLHVIDNAILHYRYRDTLRGIFQQQFSYGRGFVQLYKKYGPAGLGLMPAVTDHTKALTTWWGLVKGGVKISFRPKSDRAKWTAFLGYHLGRLFGSLEYQVLVL